MMTAYFLHQSNVTTDTYFFMCTAANFYLYYKRLTIQRYIHNFKNTYFVRQVIISSYWPSADKLTMENWGLGPIQFEGTWYIYLDVYMDSVYFLSKKDWLFTVIGRERIRYYLRVSHI